MRELIRAARSDPWVAVGAGLVVMFLAITLASLW